MSLYKGYNFYPLSHLFVQKPNLQTRGRKTEVEDIVIEDNQVKGIVLKNGETIESDYVVLGVGRSGANWLSHTMNKHNVKVFNNHVDIGVRVETNNIIMDDINKYLYEGKFIFNVVMNFFFG